MTEPRTFVEEVVAWHASRAREFPWRSTNDAYSVLLGELLLQRTRAENVVPVYEEMLRRWPTPERLARARETTIAKVIHPLGLTRRAPIIRALARDIVSNGGVPSRPDELIRLPGVGRYTSHAVPVFAHRASLPLVDWVIARLLRRYFGLDSRSRPNNDEELWALAEELVEESDARLLWLGVLDFAAKICKPLPRCRDCPLATSCASRKSPDSVGAHH